MAYPIKHDYKDGTIAVIRGRVWNAVARICSYWASGNYITIRKPENPSGQTPIVWDLDCIAAAPEIAHEFHAQGLWNIELPPNTVDDNDETIDTKAKLAEKTPKDVSLDGLPDSTVETHDTKIGRIGTSTKASREDHTHRLLVGNAAPPADGGQGSAGSGMRVALANHKHPLNTGNTAQTYAAGNHTHDGMVKTTDVAWQNLVASVQNAVTNASGAVSTANNALSTAQTAANNASDAKGNAQTALTKANEALTKAETALASLGGGGGGGVDLNTLQQQVQNALQSLESVQEAITTANENFTSLQEAQETINESITTVNETLTEIQQAQDQINTDMESLDDADNQHASYLARLLADLYEVSPTAITGQVASGGSLQVPEGLVETSANNLKGDANTPSVGESGKLCYSDHVHPVGRPAAGASNPGLQSGVQTTSSGGSMAMLGDSRAFTDKNNLNGATIQICTRVCTNGMDVSLFLRTLTLSPDGRIVSISGETSAKAVAEA